MADLKTLVTLQDDLNREPFITVRFFDRSGRPSKIELRSWGDPEFAKLVVRAEILLEGRVADSAGEYHAKVTVPLGKVAGIDLARFGDHSMDEQLQVARWLRGPNGLVRFNP